MKRALCSLVVLLILNYVTAVNCLADEKSDGVIAGWIVDSLTAVPIASVQLILLDKTNASVCKSAVSQDDGRFEFSEVPFGKYSLKISCPGYLQAVVDDIELNRKTHYLNLKKLALRENVVILDEVTVTHERVKGEEKIDRTVFAVNDDIRKASSSGLDMLRHIPSVSVDFMENVTLEGRSDIQFQVDGVRRNKEFVAQLDPEMIDRVEVITNPSVRYDADISGVINIILRKDRRSGVSGSVTAVLPHPDKVVANPGANVDVGYKNFRFFAGDRMNIQKFSGMESRSGVWEDPSGTIRRFKKKSTGTFSSVYNYLNYGIDWFVDDKTDFNFLGEWKTWRNDFGGDSSETRSYLGNTMEAYYQTDIEQEPHQENLYFSLFFNRELEQEGCNFDVEAYFNQQSGGADMKYKDTYYDIETFSTLMNTIQRTEIIDELRRMEQIRTDYAFLLKDVKNEVGFRSFGAWTDSESHKSFSPPDPVRESVETFNYDEWRQQLYYNMMGKSGKISWQFGVTGEYEYIDMVGFSGVEDYFLLPQASLQRDFDQTGKIKLSFNRELKRPEVYQRHPYTMEIDSLHVRSGNPDLESEIENQLELTWSQNFKKNYFSPKLYYHFTDNAIQDVTTVRDDGVSVMTQKNIGKNTEYGFGLNAALQITSRWRLNGNASLYHREIGSISTVIGDSKKQNDGLRIDATNIYSLPKDYSLFLITQYSSPEITYQGETCRDFLMLLGLGKKFSNHADLNIIYAPVISDYTYSKSIIDYPGYYEKTVGSVDAQNLFFIEFTYRFGSGKEFKKIERSVEYESGRSGGAL